MEFIRGFFDDGYSKYFFILFCLSCIPLVIDIIRNGWIIEEVQEVNQ